MDTTPRYEIKIRHGNYLGPWVEVSEWIFRSWSGPRRKDGVDYTGPVFYLGSDTVAR